MTRTVKFDGRPSGRSEPGSTDHNLALIASTSIPPVRAGGSAGARGPRRKILAVIKSNAYGHGIVPVRARPLEGPCRLSGDLSAEGAELRESASRTGPDSHRILGRRENEFSTTTSRRRSMSRDQLRLLKKKRATQQRKRANAPFRFSSQDRHRMKPPGIPPRNPAFAPRALADCAHSA